MTQCLSAIECSLVLVIIAIVVVVVVVVVTELS